MEVWSLIEYIRDAVKDNTTLNAWVSDNYGKDRPSISIGYEENNPPDPSTYPIITIIPTGQGRSLADDYGDINIMIGYAIEESRRFIEANVTTYKGIEMILTFRKTVEDILFATTTDLGGAYCKSADELIDALEAFPYFVNIVNYIYNNPDRWQPIA
uniref:Tail protein n=1 Tax=viral metagenome TaxID=1070528 RepID=A0A6M3KX16_9ZZZZ